MFNLFGGNSMKILAIIVHKYFLNGRNSIQNTVSDHISTRGKSKAKKITQSSSNRQNLKC